MKMLRAAPAGLLVLLFLNPIAILAQTRPLNPTVSVLPRPSSPVPSECEQGLAPEPSPRIEVADLPDTPQPSPMVAPPGRTLRGRLAEAQAAAERGDRDPFRDALAMIKAMLTTYPPGGERDAAAEAVRVYSDIDRLWTYQFEDPAGAFFDPSTGLLDMMRAYPGYAAAIEPETLVVEGTRLYPSAETRAWLVREAAKRLSSLGITLPPPSARKAPVREAADRFPTAARPQPAATSEARSRKPANVAPSPRVGDRHPVIRKHAQKGQTAGAGTARHATRRKSARHAAPAERHSTVTHAEAPGRSQTATPATTTGTASATHPSTASAAPATGGHELVPTSGSTSEPAAATSGTSGMAGSTASTGTAVTAADTGASVTGSAPTNTAATALDTRAVATSSSAVATDTASTGSSGSTEQPARGKNVILPIILIVIGLGVLIALFRASS